MSGSQRILYIMGRGHSGSTILAGLLGGAREVEDIGELIYPMRNLCGCGAPFASCEFWQRARAEFEAESGLEWEESILLIREQAHIRQFPRTWFAARRSLRVQNLVAVNRHIVSAVLSVSGKQWVLDSSKQPTRALLLMRHVPEAQFVHVIRSPDGYFRSYLSRLRSGKVNFFRREYRSGWMDWLLLLLVALSWVVANLQCELVRLLAPDRVLRVRFEDLVQDPGRELQRLGEFAGLDLESVIAAVARGERMEVGHIIGGNDHMRASGGFRVERGQAAPPRLPWGYQAVVRMVSWPLMLAYRYPLLAS